MLIGYALISPWYAPEWAPSLDRVIHPSNGYFNQGCTLCRNRRSVTSAFPKCYTFGWPLLSVVYLFGSPLTKRNLDHDHVLDRQHRSDRRRLGAWVCGARSRDRAQAWRQIPLPKWEHHHSGGRAFYCLDHRASGLSLDGGD